jgi:hypothetical protein
MQCLIQHCALYIFEKKCTISRTTKNPLSAKSSENSSREVSIAMLIFQVVTNLLHGISLQVYTYYNFGPVTAYLAVNYLDRFLSRYELPVRTTTAFF